MGEYAAQWNVAADRRAPHPVWYAGIAALAAAVAAGILLSLWLETLVALVGLCFLLAVVFQPLIGLLAWLVAAPVLNYYVRIPFPAGVPDVTFQRMVVGLLLVVVFTPVILGRKPFPRMGGTGKAMLAFSAIGLVLCFVGTPPVTRNLELFFRAYPMAFLIYFITTQVVRSDRDIRTALWLVALLAAYLSAIGIYQRFTGNVLFVPASADLNSTYLWQVGRATGPFSSSVEFGAVVAAGLLAIFLLVGHRRNDLQAAVLWLVVPLTALAMLYSYTRAVWLGFLLAAVGTYGWAPRLRRLLARTALLGAVAAAIATPILWSDTLFAARVQAVNPLTGRLLMYPTALRMAIHRPLFGYGVSPTTFGQARGEFFGSFAGIGTSTGQYLNPPHNELLHVLVLTGFVGLAAYVAIYVTLWRRSRRLKELLAPGDTFGQSCLAFYRGVFILLFVNAFFIDLVFLTYLTTFAFFIFGLMQAQLQLREAARTAGGAGG